jgi:hypothetical protein
MGTHLLDEGDEMIAFLGEQWKPICWMKVMRRLHFWERN